MHMCLYTHIHIYIYIHTLTCKYSGRAQGVQGSFGTRNFLLLTSRSKLIESNPQIVRDERCSAAHACLIERCSGSGCWLGLLKLDLVGQSLEFLSRCCRCGCYCYLGIAISMHSITTNYHYCFG